ncbi:MAG: ComF family protein [Deltaproteobacteria bacterium]|jgi:ComF family protein|nr:ComF family protein [Deltaproteobacteria bacterium]MBW2651580.1 ComF family protein [Deltaproteobacteria bacterium]MCK5514521.1 ComF family protein [Deltaproteobacteria bacterium]NOQ86498.1 ComF family protein [Deltaproteobacteria bacterium]
MRALIKSIIDFIFPPICYICGSPFDSEGEMGICPHCLSQIKYIECPFCTLCGKPFYSEVVTDHLCGDCLTRKRYFSKARAVGYYDGVLRKATHLLKYKLKNHLALHLGNIMAQQMQYLLNGIAYHSIIPVPLHPERLRERGFNQALFLARSVSEKHKIPLDGYTLTRNRWTDPQVGLSERDREDNVRGAFLIIERDKVTDRNILLVDDVYTSGNTVEECSKTLIKAGASRVDVLTLARVA